MKLNLNKNRSATIGIIICLLLCRKDDGKYNIKFDDVLLLVLFLLPVSIICARLYFLIFKLDYYIQKPIDIFNIRNGGLAIYGGIIRAIETIIVFCKIKKIKILDILVYFAPYLALGQCIGRWGNFFNGEAHGTETTSLFRMGIVENGAYIQEEIKENILENLYDNSRKQSNLMDRAFRGFVIDFIDIHILIFPNFNIADMSIVIGVILFMIIIIPKYNNISEKLH